MISIEIEGVEGRERRQSDRGHYTIFYSVTGIVLSSGFYNGAYFTLFYRLTPAILRLTPLIPSLNLSD